MICEPPSDKNKIKQMVNNFISENNIIQTLKNRIPDFHGDEITLYFVRPSKDYPIGWEGGQKSSFFSGEITEYAIVVVNIPWDSESSDDFSFFFTKTG